MPLLGEPMETLLHIVTYEVQQNLKKVENHY